MSDTTWMPSSAEPVAQYQPKTAEPVQQSQGNPIINAVTQPLAQTLTGQSMQNRIMDISGTPIPQSISAPFDAGVQTGSNPLFRANDIAQRFVGGAIGNLADQVTTPSNLMLGAALSKGASMLVNNPVTRRFLQTQLPTLSKDLLAANPMDPIYKTINGIQADINKPLPPNASRLVQIGKDLKDSIQDAISTIGKKFKPLVGENPLTPEEVQSVLPYKIKDGENGERISLESTEIAKKLGIDPSQIKTTADLWQARTDLKTAISDNAFNKGDLFRNNNIKEQDVMDLMEKMKGLVMNKMSPVERQSLDVLDNHYGNAIGAGRSLMRSIYNPDSGEVKTGTLLKLFDKSSDSYEGKQDLIGKLNYFNSNVGKFSQQVLKHVQVRARNDAIKKAVPWVIRGSGVLGAGMYGYKKIMESVNDSGGSPNDNGNSGN